MPYASENFISQYHEMFICHICLSVPDPREAVELLSCGHIFCSSCIATELKRNTGVCPSCQERPSSPTPRSIAKENPFVFRQMQALQVRCNYWKLSLTSPLIDSEDSKKSNHNGVDIAHGHASSFSNDDHSTNTQNQQQQQQQFTTCKWSGPLAELPSHLKLQCQCVPVRCKWSGCDSFVQRQFIQHHEATCSYRLIRCTYCNDELPFREQEPHLETTCPEYPVLCPNQCTTTTSTSTTAASAASAAEAANGYDEIDTAVTTTTTTTSGDHAEAAPPATTTTTITTTQKTKVLRKHLQEHLLTSCPLELIDCPLKRDGCLVEKFPRCRLNDHMQEACVEHMLLLNKQIKHTQDAVDQLMLQVHKHDKNIKEHAVMLRQQSQSLSILKEVSRPITKDHAFGGSTGRKRLSLGKTIAETVLRSSHHHHHHHHHHHSFGGIGILHHSNLLGGTRTPRTFFRFSTTQKGSEIVLNKSCTTATKDVQLGWQSVAGDIVFTSGKHYWEVKVEKNSARWGIAIGVAEQGFEFTKEASIVGQFGKGWSWWSYENEGFDGASMYSYNSNNNNNNNSNDNNSSSNDMYEDEVGTPVERFVEGDVIGLFLDMDGTDPSPPTTPAATNNPASSLLNSIMSEHGRTLSFFRNGRYVATPFRRLPAQLVPAFTLVEIGDKISILQ